MKRREKLHFASHEKNFCVKKVTLDFNDVKGKLVQQPDKNVETGS